MLRMSVISPWALCALLLVLAGPFSTQNAAYAAEKSSMKMRSLTGQFLVARPEMPDPRFRESVIFVARHDENGAFGLIINKPLGEIDYATLLGNLGLDADGLEGTMALFFGGPVDPQRGFILHSNDYPHPPLIPVNDQYSITISTDLILAIASGFGPKRSLLAIGYAGWGAGQLESELERKDWVLAPSDEKILFDTKFEDKWKRAYDSRFLDI